MDGTDGTDAVAVGWVDPIGPEGLFQRWPVTLGPGKPGVAWDSRTVGF